MNAQNRTAYAAKNILWGYVGNIFSILLAFVTRTVFIYTIGLEFLGVNGLFTNVLGVLSFTELGVGVALNFSLYKPAAQGNREKLKSLMRVYKNAYRLIALVVTVIGVALLPALPYIIKGAEALDQSQIPLYYLIFLFNTVTSYFVTYKYGIVNAEQKGYLLTNIDTACRGIISILQAVVLILFQDFLLYLLVQAAAQLLQKLFTALYIDRKYPYLKEKDVQPLEEEEAKRLKTNVKALVIHKIGDISVHQTDNIVISAFLSVTLTGIVSNYTMLLTTATTLLAILFNALTASLGNLIATESKERQLALFEVYHFLGFLMYGFVTICFIALIQPLMSLWVGAQNRIDTVSMVLMMSNLYLMGQRTTVNNFAAAGGMFNEGKYIALIQAVVNLVLNIVLVQLIGLPGIYIGTVIQGLIANIARPVIMYRVLFKRHAGAYFRSFLKYLLVAGVMCVLMYLLSSQLLKTLTAWRFIGTALLVAGLCAGVLFLLFRKDSSFLFLKEKVQSLLKGRKTNAA
ncbi:MAG: polysaccharide biosynthesis C-terminal domain-containing protein [Christensenellales bacterium]|jgi:O-antigen/teichoic acid export membrane protein